MELRLHQLQALVQVVDRGGIRAAARACGLTQAALTKALRQLEEEAGAALLVRSVRGVSLTEAGERVHARARLILQEVALAAHELEEFATASRSRVDAALSPGIIASALPPAFEAFRRHHPDADLGLFEGLAHKALPGLRAGTLDFAMLIDDGDLSPEEFRVRNLGTAVLTPVVRRGHPVLQAPSLAALSRLEWLFTGLRRGPRLERFRAMFHRAGLPAPQRMLQCDAIVALDLLHHTDLAMMMPLTDMDGLGGGKLAAVAVPQLTQPVLKLVLVTRLDARLTPAAAALVDCLLQVMAGSSSRTAAPERRRWT